MRLKDKVALVTGGGAGIGRATAELFAREGAAVGVAEIDAATGEAAVKAITDAGGRAIFIRTDVSQPEQVEAAVAATAKAFGGLDVLYNNVGGSSVNDGTVENTPFAEFQKKMNIDLFGVWLGSKYAVPEMIKRGGGSIVNAVSICSLRGMRNRAAYSAAKGGVNALTMSMAVDFAKHRIRVNAIAPGSTQTERILDRRKTVPANPGMVERHILGLIDPVDIAYAVLYFASEESRRTTGQTLTVDSGFTIT